MKIIQIPKKGKTSIIGILVPVGSRKESPELKGISHFIEHMCFKETKNRTSYDISQSIEQYGGTLNAFTDWELTCYWAKISNKYLKKAENVIKDLVINPLFPTKEIEKEREVIIQELKMYEDNPQTFVYDLFNSIYFTKQSTFHTSTIGTEKTLHAINKKEILKFYNEYYKNLTLIGVGDVYKKTNQLISPVNYPASLELSNTNKNKKIYLHKRQNIRQANILIGNYLSPINGTIKDSYSLRLLECIYNDMSGRLFIKLREKNNLCYTVCFDTDIYSEGLIFWNVYIALEKNKINKARDLIIKAIDRPFTKQEIKMAIQKMLGKQDFKLDNVKYIFETVAYSEIKSVDYREFLNNATKNIIKAGKTINEFRKKLNYKDNLLVGVIPK